MIKNLCILLASLSSAASAQAAKNITFGGDEWTVKEGEAKIEQYAGRSGVLLLNHSAVFLDDLSLQDGVIEFDVNHPSDRAFLGVIFRAVDFENFEEFYFRPHLSETPDSVQYTPVFNDVYGWQLYSGDGYTGPMKQKADTWRHVKLIVKGTKAAVFIDDMKTPVLFIHELNREPKAGKVGLRLLSYGSVAHFSNFKASADANIQLPEEPSFQAAQCDSCIKEWSISEPYAYDAELTPSQAKEWMTVNAEKSGLLNIAKFKKRYVNGANTVFVKTTLRSDDDKLTKINFGYSEVTTVFLNGQPLYSGQNTYGSRDYRYLGTIGFFDQVYLPLRKGENELVFSVSESFGGWGLKAKLEDD